jgi:hypothetical protein
MVKKVKEKYIRGGKGCQKNIYYNYQVNRPYSGTIPPLPL